MNCPDVRPHLALHPDPAESPVLREDIDAHLRQCAACAAEAQRLHSAWTLLDAWDAPPAPDLVDRVRARIEHPVSASRPLLFRRWLPLAAAAGVLVAVLSLIPRDRPQEGAASPMVAAAEVDIVQNLDLLEDYDVADGLDLLAADLTLDDAQAILDLLPADAPNDTGREY